MWIIIIGITITVLPLDNIIIVTFVCYLFMRRWWWWYQTCLSANIQPGVPGRGDSERDLWRDGKRTGSVLQVWLSGTAVWRLRRPVRWPGQDARPSLRGGQCHGWHVVAEPVSAQRWPVPVRNVHDRLETGERKLAVNFKKKNMWCEMGLISAKVTLDYYLHHDSFPPKVKYSDF